MYNDFTYLEHIEKQRADYDMGGKTEKNTSGWSKEKISTSREKTEKESYDFPPSSEQRKSIQEKEESVGREEFLSYELKKCNI